MCQKASGSTGEPHLDSHPRRILKVAGGKVTQCMDCHTIGIEVGTTYMVFNEAEFDRFADWFVKSCGDGSLRSEKGRIRFCLGDPNLQMSLSEPEVRSLIVLLQHTHVWIHRARTRPGPSQGDTTVSAWVH